MKRIGELIVKLRIPIILLSFLLVIPSAISFLHMRINYDLLSYLPSELDTMKGQDILMDEFGKGAYAIFVCNGMEDKDVAGLKSLVEEVDHVDNVVWYDTLSDLSVPASALPSKITDVFYSGNSDGTLMFIFFDTTTSADETLNAVEEIQKIAGKQCFLSSMSVIVDDMKNLVQNEMLWYVVIAALLTSVVLAVSMDSSFVPVMIMLTIGMSIIYNLGTNFIAGEISFITMALVAVLQLGVTMDYSIFLYSSYKEQKGLTSDHKEAMAEAIAATIVSITGSSLTTIAGFVALCFMSFTLGMDLGVVMVKGVILGVLGCVTILPSLLMVGDKLIEKTTRRSVDIPTDGVVGFVTSHPRILAIIMVILWLPSLYGNNHVNVYYKISSSLPADAACVQADEVMREEFDMKSVSMVLVHNTLDHKTTVNMLNAIRDVDGIKFALGLDSVVGSLVPDVLIPDEAREILESEHWKLIMVASEYELATDEVNEQCETLDAIIKHYDPEGMLIGETAGTKDLIQVTARDFNVVNTISIAAIFVLIMLVLKSISLPILLVLVIELAINMNMGASFYLNQTLPFIASVCVGTIQLGATVDYAILMTNRYKTERQAGYDKVEATKIALSTSMHSIMCSAAGFFAATVGVGLYSSADLIGSICILLARGALISMVIVIAFLPCMYLLFDKLICYTTLGMKDCVHK